MSDNFSELLNVDEDSPDFDAFFAKHIGTLSAKHPVMIVRQLAKRLIAAESERDALREELRKAREQEPIYQFRKQFLGAMRNDRQWTQWCDCTKQQLDNYSNGISEFGFQDTAWAYETRTIYASPVPAQNTINLPKCAGVSVDAESPGKKGVIVFFERALNDAELRTLHEHLSGGAS